MNKALNLLFVICFFSLSCIAQEKENTTQEIDSVTTNLKKEGIVIGDSTIFKKRKAINPLAPSKAAFYSAILPGLGQIYNKRYWKTPIVFAAMGTGVYAYTFNNDRYVRFRDAFKSRRAGFITDEFYDLNGDGNGPDLDLEDLQSQQERFQRDRDLALVVTILIYALNIVDANVDSHLKQFNIDNDLSLDFKPYLEYNQITSNPNYGMALTIKF